MMLVAGEALRGDRGTPYDRTDAKTGIRTYYLVEEAP